jgi:hypothetical protein
MDTITLLYPTTHYMDEEVPAPTMGQFNGLGSVVFFLTVKEDQLSTCGDEHVGGNWGVREGVRAPRDMSCKDQQVYPNMWYCFQTCDRFYNKCQSIKINMRSDFVLIKQSNNTNV